MMFSYQFIIGGIVFAIGIIFAYRQGYLSIKENGLRNLLFVMIPLFFILYSRDIFNLEIFSTGPPVPFYGDPDRSPTLGAPIDYGIMVFYFLLILINWYLFRKAAKNG
jgi:hypothetical protein